MPARMSALVVAFALALAGLVAAQETTGTISGRVVDAQGLAVPGVTITITGPQGYKSFVTDAEGRYSASFLTPGMYTVRAELQGFKASETKNVNVSLGQTTGVTVTLQVGGLTETVEVTGAPSAIDVRSTSLGAVISSDTVRRLPVGRRVSDVTYLAPGVSNSGSVGAQNPSISGGSGLDNQYVVDGVNITNQGYGALGSYSIIFGSLGNATPFDFVQEVQVKTGGYEAEFGQAIGGVVNVITKSGSNNVRGSAFGYTRPQQLEGDWKQFQSTNGSVQTSWTESYDVGVEGGFPIVKDRLFFFGAIDPQWDRAAFRAPAGFPLESLGDVERKRRNTTYAAKGTFQLNSSHRFDASFFGDPSKGDMGPQRMDALLVSNTASFSELTQYGGHNQTVRYDGVLGGQFLLEAAYSRALNRIVETPSVNDWRVRDRTVTPNIITGGVGAYEAGNRSLNNQYLAKATNVVAGHQVRYGVEFDDVEYSQINQRTGPTFTTPRGDMTATGASIDILRDPNFGQIYRVVRANLNTARVTTQKYLSFFVQDSWTPTDRLTINPGLRYEQETLSGTLVQDWKLKNNWAPRIGVAYDLTGDHKTKLFGNYGRYYARVPNDLAARALSADAGIGADYFDAALTRPIPDGVLAGPPGSQTPVHYSIAGAGADTIDPNAKLSYTHEVVAGVEREVMSHTSVGVKYIYRNFGRILEDVANAPFAAYDLQVPGASSVDYLLTNPSSSTPALPAAAFLGAHFDDPVHKYNAVEFSINRRLANNWSALASYRWSRLRGNFEGFYRDDNGQSDPGITSLYDFPTNDPSYTAIGTPQFGYRGDVRFLGDPNGILPLDRPHQIKVYGNYVFDMGLNLGVGLRMNSGKPLTPLAANPNTNYQNGGEIPEAARGTGIQTIDGFRTRSPFESQVDLQASYAFRLGGARQLTLIADVFNLFNERRIIDYDQWTELTFGVPNPDFGKPVTQVLRGVPPQFQTPMQVRIGARFGF